MASTFASQMRDFLNMEGYTMENIVDGYSFAYRESDGTLKNAEATVAGFAQSPHTMRNACIGAYEVQGTSEIPGFLSQARYLTAPMAIIKTPSDVRLFRVRTTVDSSPLETSSLVEFPNKFKSRIADLSPEIILSAKLSGRHHDLFDVGLFHWAEDITSDTLAKLLEAVVLEGIQDLPDSYRSREPAQKAVIKLVFHLFACRVLQDKKLIKYNADPYDSLRAAHEAFSDNIDAGAADSPYLSRAGVNQIANKLHSRFAFSSLTSEMLGNAYENALVTPKLRKERGIYYTPRFLTSYILSQLPIESVAEDDRYLCDPCCGSGSFLLAGFERLGELLSDNFTPSKKHQYLRTRILGFDIDEFAREIATLSLTLGDIYNKNGWKVKAGDATDIGSKDLGRRPHIIVTNPPFRHTKEAGKRKEIAADILINLIELLVDGGLMGVVLPQSFLDSGAAEKARRVLLDRCDLLEIDLLSAGVFFSGAETAVILLRKRRKGEAASHGVTTIREVRPSDISSFKTKRFFTRTYSVESKKWRVSKGQKFVISPLAAVWERLQRVHPRLSTFACLSTGLQVDKTDDKSVHSKKSGDTKQFVDRLEVLRPFTLLPDDGTGKYKWLDYGDQLRRSADPKVFEAKKVLLNATRNAGSVWRILAAIAPEGLYFSDYFHAIIPKSSLISFEDIVAVLNGPIANAWFDANCRKRKIILKTLGDLPFPMFSPEQRAEIKVLVRNLGTEAIAKWKKQAHGLYEDKLSPSDKSAELLGRLDAVVANAYGLSSDEVWQLSKVVKGDKRPS